MKVERRSDLRPHTQERKEEAEDDPPATPAGADHEAWGELGQREKSSFRAHNKSGNAAQSEKWSSYSLHGCICASVMKSYLGTDKYHGLGTEKPLVHSTSSGPHDNPVSSRWHMPPFHGWGN